ncbi:MAG: hypothetical protein JW850_21965 [Thermoflexales bacterium]|nr:hypothetical protein [Thermoflexales bacterium]
MSTKTVLRMLIMVSLLVGVFPVLPAAAQTPNFYTSVSITNISGSPIVEGIFTTDVVVSVSNSGSSSLVGVMGAEIYVSYNPAVVRFAGLSLRSGFFDSPYGSGGTENPCTVATNSITNTACVHIVATQQPGAGPVYNRTGTLATIQWMGVAAGVTDLTVLPGTLASPLSKLVDTDGYDVYINHTVGATIDIRSVGTIQGCVTRRGYIAPSKGPITVTASIGASMPITQTTTDNCFVLSVPMWGTYVVQAWYPGYLAARKTGVYVAGASPRGIDIGTTVLQGGDVNGDNLINIYDLVKIGVYYNASGLAPRDAVDINDDGTVNIYDLTIAASNYNKTGPTAW